MRNNPNSSAGSVPGGPAEALGQIESLEASLGRILKMLEEPGPDAMEQCSRLLEPCVGLLAGLRDSVGRERAAGAPADAGLRSRMEAVHGQLQRLGALVRHAAEFQIGCAAAGVAAPTAYTPQGTPLPELPVGRLRMEG